jgi:hypothetical protein
LAIRDAQIHLLLHYWAKLEQGWWNMHKYQIEKNSSTMSLDAENTEKGRKSKRFVIIEVTKAISIIIVGC